MGGCRNEGMREEGRGKRRMNAGGLDPQTAALVRVAAALAEGKIPELEARFAAAREAEVPALWIEELLLQSMLVVGYPLALVAFGVWHGMRGGRGGGDPLGRTATARSSWRTRTGSRGPCAAPRCAARCTAAPITNCW